MKPARRNPQTKMTYWMNRTETQRTYPQKWTEYNKSQTSEKLMFMNILRELSQYISIEEKKRRGRPTLNVQEMIYCIGLLTYCGKSSRRTISELNISKDRGMISKVPHFNTILNYFNNQNMTSYLQYLITLASMPLKMVEKDFTADSSGFSTSFFGRWYDHKWGKKEDHRLWRKAHVMSGVKTNIVTAIQVDKGTSSDTKAFPELVKRTDLIFNMSEVSADLAYSSRNNLDVVHQCGAIPFIPFKKNVTGKAKGTMIWRKMFLYFAENYDEFMEHYHKRSNAESVFSMIKRKFDMHLKCKNEIAQDNEILCKILCHNIVVLIHEIFELGIDVEFDECVKNMDYCAFNASAQKIQSEN